VAHQVTQLVFIGRRARFAAGHITAAKLLFSFEDSRLEKRQQVVKLDKRVLNGSRREQQQKAFVESVDRLPVRGRAVLQMARLVDDHDVVILFGQNLLMFGAARRLMVRWFRLGGDECCLNSEQHYYEK